MWHAWDRRAMFFFGGGGISEKKMPLGRPSHKWKDNIKMELYEIGWKAVDLLHLTQDADR